MRRTEIIVVIGAVVAAAGTILAVKAGSLATSWQRTESGNGWGGRTDPALQHTYSTMGLIGLGFGLALVALAAWRWLSADRARLR